MGICEEIFGKVIFFIPPRNSIEDNVHEVFLMHYVFQERKDLQETY